MNNNVPPYPRYTNGWFQVAWSNELKRGAVLSLHYFGNELVLYRGRDGTAYILNAHCPHLGAHLGVGGRVEGNCIRCPFHGWKFNGQGNCESIPYAKKIPPKAKIVAWPLIERDGMIFMWQSNKNTQPEYVLPEIEKFKASAYSTWIKHVSTIHSHSLDILENSVDSAHFKQCHGFDGANIEIQHGAILEIKQHISVKLLGKRLTTTAHYHMIEPGFHYVWINIPFLLVLLVCSITPINEEKVVFRMSFAFHRFWPKLLDPLVHFILKVSVVKKMIAAVINDDMPIWQNKAFRISPILCDGDGPFGVLRRWYMQFSKAN